MNARGLPLALLLLSGALGAEPRYEDWTKYLLSAPDYRLEQIVKGKWPYLEVLRKDRLREYQKGKCDPTKGQDCSGRLPWAEAQAHEFYLPLSSLEATREVARDLRRAWQRFEERYYWRVITELNNPAFWFAYCWAGIRGPELAPPLPDFRLQVPSEGVDPAFLEAATRQGPLDMGRWASAGLHSLDRYLPVPQVDPREFCDGLGLQILPLMYIPGFKVLLQGYEVFRTPGYPSRPLWFNWDEANARVERAMRKALTEYYLDYQKEVARILLTPRPSTPQEALNLLGGGFRSLGAPKVYLPVPWQGHLLGGGSVVAPAYTELVPTDPTTLWNQVQSLWNAYKGLIDRAGSEVEKAYLYVHFYRAARTLFQSKAFYGLPGMDAVKENLVKLVEAPLRSLTQSLPVLRGLFRSRGEPGPGGLVRRLGPQEGGPGGEGGGEPAGPGRGWGRARQGGAGIPGPLEVRGGQALASPLFPARLRELRVRELLPGPEHPGGHHGPRHPQRGPLLGEPGQLDGLGLEPAIPPGGVLARAPHHRRPGGVLPPVRPRLPLPAPRGARPAPGRTPLIDLSSVNLGNWISWAWNQLSRLVVYWHVPLTIDVRVEYCPPCVLAYPSLPLEGPVQPLGVPPYVLPFALERTHWRWISVPEGYEVPGVRGTPYRPLGDLSALTSLVDLSAFYRILLGR